MATLTGSSVKLSRDVREGLFLHTHPRLTRLFRWAYQGLWWVGLVLASFHLASHVPLTEAELRSAVVSLQPSDHIGLVRTRGAEPNH